MSDALTVMMGTEQKAHLLVNVFRFFALFPRCPGRILPMNVRLIQRAAKLHGVLACAVVPDGIDLVLRHGGLQRSCLEYSG
jgi:hypothetical protein